jgi:hypothetical protein
LVKDDLNNFKDIKKDVYEARKQIQFIKYGKNITLEND